MKNVFSGSLAYLLCVIIVFTVGCKREVVKHEPLAVDCRITQIISKGQGSQIKSGSFTYNHLGYPLSYTPAGYSPKSVKYEFRYDDKNRLTDYIGYYPSGSSAGVFEFWTRFVYDNKNRVTRDTTYHYGRYGSEISNFTHVKEITTYQYDAFDRVSGTVMRQFYNGQPNGVMGDYRYVYNADGNLVGAGLVYDNKVSVFRTSKIWMFLNRNYSRNNVKPTRGYNSKGLPVGFTTGGQQYSSFSMLYFLELQDCDIMYDCN